MREIAQSGFIERVTERAEGSKENMFYVHHKARNCLRSSEGRKRRRLIDRLVVDDRV